MSCGRISETVEGNLFIRRFPLVRGEAPLESHSHNFDHVSYCALGRVLAVKMRPEVDANGVIERRDDGLPRLIEIDRREMEPGDHMLIRSHEWHTFSLLDGCDVARVDGIFSHRDPDGTVTRDYRGYAGAYR